MLYIYTFFALIEFYWFYIVFICSPMMCVCVQKKWREGLVTRPYIRDQRRPPYPGPRTATRNRSPIRTRHDKGKDMAYQTQYIFKTWSIRSESVTIPTQRKQWILAKPLVLPKQNHTLHVDWLQRNECWRCCHIGKSHLRHITIERQCLRWGNVCQTMHPTPAV